MEHFRKFLNKRVFDFLRNLDDDPTKKREVTHWFYFENLDDLERFEKYAFEIGYKTMNKPSKTKGKDYLLIIYKTEEINEDSINFDTLDFWKKAEEFNGVYDGWETKIE